MKKILFLSFYIFFTTPLFAQQKDTLTLIVGKKPGDYLEKRSDYWGRLQKVFDEIIQTTPERFFLDNAGIKSEFVKCYFDTSIVKTTTDKEMATQMVFYLVLKNLLVVWHIFLLPFALPFLYR